MSALLPTTASAVFAGRTRRVALQAGARYRVEPLNPRRRRLRGLTGTLRAWDMAGTVGWLRLADGSDQEVGLADLIAVTGAERSARRRAR